MGDLFFIIRMSIYTVIIVLVMQIKIGPKTVEDRVINFTHKSQFAGVIQEFAQGAVAFLGVQYNNVAGKVNTKFFRSHGNEQAPGKRLESKLSGLKSVFGDRINESKESIQNEMNEASERVQDGAQDLKSKSNEIKESLSEYEI